MEPPVFEEFDPESDCDCPGCAARRRAARNSPTGPFGCLPPAHRALVVATATAAALGAAPAAHVAAAPRSPDPFGVPAGDEPETPQGVKAPLHGPAGPSVRPGGAAGPVVTPVTTRSDIIGRAREWVSAQVPYNMSGYWWDGYRQDCSGFVSMAWNLPHNEWTGSLHQFGTRISKEELRPGDILLFHNPSDPEKGSHVVLFGGWTDYTHSYYVVYEQTRPATRRQATPYAYWSHSDRYVPYRYKGLRPAAQSTGEKSGAGGGSEAGNRGAIAERDGDKPRGQPVALPALPGRSGAASGSGAGAAEPDAAPDRSAPRVPAYPGRGVFRPGAQNVYVTQLGRQLVKKGFGGRYARGPGPRWGETDRRAVESFQRAQGWRGGAAAPALGALEGLDRSP
ncbi:peptidoglycan-binding protein, partial [Streptomyces sp. ID05-04B]|uniref:peptidoglycan-binding protein n=1 Tax=Streptomyces sp. ID05-04B TaxID=3028661 RepID=UPI0029C5D940